MEQLPAPSHSVDSIPERVTRPAYTRSYSTAYHAVYPDPMQDDSSQDSASAGLIDYWRILKRRRGSLVLVTFMGLLAAFLVTLPQTPMYRARAAIEIQSINSDFLNAKQLTPVSEDWTGAGALTDVQTQMRILQSENLLGEMIDKFKDASKAAPLQPRSSPFVESLKNILRLPAVDAAGADYRMRQRALKALTVRQAGQTRMVEISFDSEDPQFASDFLNALVASYIESNIQARWQMSERTGQWLSGQLDEMRVKLERSEDALQKYARRSGLLYTAPSFGRAEKTDISEEKLRQLQEALSQAQADRAAAQSRYEIAKSAPPDTVAEVLNDANLRDLQAKLTDLRRQQAELITIYTPKHEKVRRIEAQIVPLETAFNQARAAILDRIHNDYQAAIGREGLLHADYVSQTRVVTDQGEKSIQYNILKHEVDSNQQLYESMMQQVKEASVASAMRASNIRVVDPAKAPYKPYSPDYLLNCGLGLLSGLLVAIAFVVMSERADRTLQQPGDIEFWTRASELGAIPSATLDMTRRLYYAKSKALREPEGAADTEGATSTKALGLGVRNGTNRRVELMTWNNKPSVIAESFRTVLTSIMFSGENGSRPRLLVLTSANPMEGKTTVASNLGIALAEIRQKVLIIDADLRKPRIHEVFNVPNDLGLSDLLRSQSRLTGDLEAALRATTHQTAIPGLSVLPSGPSTHAAANLLYSPALAEILNIVRSDFDMILVDTPPMLQMTDARVVGRLADGVILVARAGHITRDAAIAAHQRFADDHIRVLGAILNDWNPRKSPNGYYGYHQGQYYHSGKHYNGYYGK